MIEIILVSLAEEDTEDMHKHKCPDPECGTIWEHGETCFGEEEAHKCPKCGTYQWTRYNGGQEN